MRRKKGIGLIELAIYAVGVSILAGAAIFGISSHDETAKKAAATAEVSVLAQAVSRYRYEVGSYPANLETLKTTNDSTGRPYLVRLPTQDPYGTTNSGIGGSSPYAYAKTSKGFAVWSFGKNKANNSGGGSNTLPTAFSGDDIGFLGQ